MRITNVGLMAALAIAASATGCSGNFEVGSEADPLGGTSSGSGGFQAAAPGQAGKGQTAGCGGGETGGGCNVGPSEPGQSMGDPCPPTGKPAALAGPFVEPSVVWSRLTMLTLGVAMPPPADLPEETSYEWAGEVVTRMFELLPEEVPGAQLFVEEWLFPAASEIADDAPVLDGDWAHRLAGDAPALERLLLSDLGEQRYGIFSERSWLARHQRISPRGAALAYTLLQRLVPPPPPELPMAFEPRGMTERANMAQTLDSPACVACHSFMDPLAFPFQHFDAAGEYRELDNGLPIDTSGEYTLDFETIAFDGPQEFGEQVAASCEGQMALADGFVKAAMAINRVAADAQVGLFEANHARVRQAFVRSSQRSYADLVRAYAQSALVLRP